MAYVRCTGGCGIEIKCAVLGYGQDAPLSRDIVSAWNTRTPLAAPAVEWQPIETVPKDGTEVLLAHSNSQWLDQWTMANELDGFWMMCDQWEEPETPTHWKPLSPLPPAPEAKEEGDQ